jgi:hypothetical protein
MCVDAGFKEVIRVSYSERGSTQRDDWVPDSQQDILQRSVNPMIRPSRCVWYQSTLMYVVSLGDEISKPESHRP